MAGVIGYWGTPVHSSPVQSSPVQPLEVRCRCSGRLAHGERGKEVERSPWLRGVFECATQDRMPIPSQSQLGTRIELN